MTKSISFRKTCPALTRQDDFFDFWHETMALLASQDYAIQIKHTKTRPDGLTLRWLSFKSLNGSIVEGYLISWDDSPERPLVIHTHGYIGQCDEMWQWAKQGVHVFGVDIRGLGRSINAIPFVSPHGFVLTGFETHYESVLRGSVCDYIRAFDVAISLLRGKPERTVFYGYSFGGALALMATAVSQRPDLLVSAVPTFGWAEGRRSLVKNGSGLEINQFLKNHPEHESVVMQELTYFDTMNFADKINCPALVGLGRRDSIVPAATVYAIINHLGCRHEIREFPVSHSQEPEEQLWADFEKEWLLLAVNGVPDTFGTLTQGMQIKTGSDSSI